MKFCLPFYEIPFAVFDISSLPITEEEAALKT